VTVYVLTGAGKVLAVCQSLQSAKDEALKLARARVACDPERYGSVMPAEADMRWLAWIDAALISEWGYQIHEKELKSAT